MGSKLQDDVTGRGILDVSTALNLRPKILMLASGPLAAAGPGAVTRSYQFACALSRFGELTLVQITPGPSRSLPESLRANCARIIPPNDNGERFGVGKWASSKLASRAAGADVPVV